MFWHIERSWHFPLQQLDRCECTNTCLMWNGHLKHLRAESMEKRYTGWLLRAARRHFSASPKIRVLKHKQEKKHWVASWSGANVITARAPSAVQQQPGLRVGAAARSRTKKNTHFSFQLSAVFQRGEAARLMLALCGAKETKMKWVADAEPHAELLHLACLRLLTQDGVRHL